MKSNKYSIEKIIQILSEAMGSMLTTKRFTVSTPNWIYRESQRFPKNSGQNQFKIDSSHLSGSCMVSRFVDVFIRKRKLRILFLIDDFTRILHGVCVSFSITASTVQKVIEKSIYTYSRPRILRTDNGPEFREKTLNLFLKNSRIKHEFIDKGKPYQNGFRRITQRADSKMNA